MTQVHKLTFMYSIVLGAWANSSVKMHQIADIKVYMESQDYSLLSWLTLGPENSPEAPQEEAKGLPTGAEAPQTALCRS